MSLCFTGQAHTPTYSANRNEPGSNPRLFFFILNIYPCEAELVREGLPRKEVEKVRRMLTEYGLSGWDMPYILIKDKELHDRIKEEEGID